MTTIRLRNTKLAIRNLSIRQGRAIIVISYTKARSSNNHAFYIIRYLPDDLGLSVVVYLTYIRPFLDFLANQLGLPHYHSNEFLFLDPKRKERHLSTTQATESLRDLTPTLQTPWTISLYRQASIAIVKRHISELIKGRNFYYPSDANTSVGMIAAGVGHRPRMLLTAYAIDTALPTRLQPELLEIKIQRGDGKRGRADFVEPRLRSIEYKDYIEHAMRWHDGRFARHPTFRFVAFNTLMRSQARARSKFFVKQHDGTRSSLTREQLIQALEHSDDPEAQALINLITRHVVSIRGTRPFWNRKRQDLKAYAYSLGCPGAFITFSPADLH
ncbi:telomere-associated recQ-like helicase [Metarhizium rileyi]|uniref:Telomere-associated recQ-like helicase n=1 Tax=Metarhizium rileyi (strain RCEF 4871) TaxID=1649241 RepID=A0A166YM01_METRR|nr:telomere-associated recQ-like helicase [Metarhizium rileyi RCEF 4871]